MTDLDAIRTLEEGDADNETAVSCIQHLIDTGTIWSLQGCYVRTARELLDAGLVQLEYRS